MALDPVKSLMNPHSENRQNKPLDFFLFLVTNAHGIISGIGSSTDSGDFRKGLRSMAAGGT